MKKNQQKRPTLHLLTLTLFMVLLSSFASAAERTYVLSYSPGTLFHQLVKDRTELAYERAGLKAEFISLPHNRSLLSANDGTVDGDVGRVPSVEENYPNLLRVNVKLMDLSGAVYTNHKDINLYNDDLLKKYRVGYVLGVRWTEKKMAGLKATTAHDYPALFEMLLQDRVDIILATEDSASEVINNLGERASNIRKIQPFVFKAPIYHYVHKKNAAIIPQLEKALTELNNEDYGAPAEGDTYVFYSGIQSPIKDILEARIQEAFRRIGKKSRIQSTGSAQRALLMANDSGDGDALRINYIKKMAPDLTTNLLQVPEPIVEIKFFAYSKNEKISVHGWESLKGYRNGLRGGVKVLEKNVPESRTVLPSSERLFQMLDQGRLDTVTEHYIVAEYLIKRMGLEHIKELSPALVSAPGYIFIHKKHRALIPEIAQSLASMKADGRFKQIKDDVINRLLTQ